DVAQLRGLGRRRLRALRFELRDAALDVANKGPRNRVRGRQVAGGQGGDGRVADADLQEAPLELVLDLVGRDVELVRPDAGQSDIQDEIRIGPSRERLDQLGLAGQRGRV